jgi:hypothetical protein
MSQSLLFVCGAIASVTVFTGTFIVAMYGFGRWESKADA